MKKHIPNIITTYRFIVALFIPALFYFTSFNFIAILFTSAIITDLIDGTLARKWNVTSDYGKILDAASDKLLAISTSSTFIVTINQYFIITLVLEIIIMGINSIIYFKYKNKDLNVIKNHSSSIYGKVKTWFLFILLFLSLLSLKIIGLNAIIFPFIIITSVFQIITAISYIASIIRNPK